jgi:hypothetical protein
MAIEVYTGVAIVLLPAVPMSAIGIKLLRKKLKILIDID